MSDPEGPATGRRANKRASAFRTIGEVAEELDLPAHVLRFWESKFPELKPLKRGGGRRYYRPEDIALLRRIRQCLYQDGYTIRGVQKLLREGGGEVEALRLAAGAAPTPEEASLFPLEPVPPPSAPARSPRPRLVQAAPPPAPRQEPARVPDPVPALRTALEDARRELIEIRALLAELARGCG